MIQKMNTKSKTIKPKNDIQLVVNRSNHCVCKELRNDNLGAGAGADAASSGVVDMALSATEPLSEIVWSPNRGFSLNCVDSSFSDKNASLYKDVTPSRMVLALLQSVTGGDSNSDMPLDDASVNPVTIICANSGISSTDTRSRHPSDQSGVVIPDPKANKEHDTGPGGSVVKIHAGRGDPDFHSDQNENLMNYCEKNFCGPANIGTVIISDTNGNKSSATSGQVEKRPVDNFILQADEPKPNMEQNPEPTELSNGGMDIDSGNMVIVTEDGLCTKVEHKIDYEGSGALASSSRSPVEKLESTAENDIQNFNCEATYAATSVPLVSVSNEDRNKSKGNGMIRPCDEDLLVSQSPCNSRIHKAMNKSKEKSLFDGNANASLSKEENDKHLSVESCNIAGLVLTGKRRCNFQKQLIIGSKRIKKQIQDTSCSTSKVKGDSSFMNLISNMMKGFSSQSTQDESNPDHHFLWPDQKLITCNENQDPESKNSYFNSNPNSISWPSMKNLETMKSNHVGESSKDFELGNKVHGINVTPINFYADNNSFYHRYLQSDEFEASTRVCDSGPSLQPKNRPIHFLRSNQNRKNNSMEKEGLALHSSPTRQDKINNEHSESYVPLFHKRDSLEVLGMASFVEKSTSPLIAFDHLKEINGSQVHSTKRSALSHPHKHFSYLNSFKIEGTGEHSADDHFLNEAKMLQDCFINKEASIGFKDHKGNNDHTSEHKLNSITPFPGFRDSEPIASMFARRLSAMKHILTDTADSIQHN